MSDWFLDLPAWNTEGDPTAGPRTARKALVQSVARAVRAMDVAERTWRDSDLDCAVRPHQGGIQMATSRIESTHRGIHEPILDQKSMNGFSEVGPTGPSENRRANTVRQDAGHAIQFLTFTSQVPAVLLARDWHVSGIPFVFEHFALYQEIAAAAHCFIVQIDRTEAGGIEHLLFATRTRGLKDEEYLACIDETSVPIPMVEAQ